MRDARGATDDVRVQGNATAEELAAVLALVRRPREATPDAFSRWRATRLAALRRERSRGR